jgi:hypothetical protein
MATYGQLRTLIRALQASDVASAHDDDSLPSFFPLREDVYVLILRPCDDRSDAQEPDHPLCSFIDPQVKPLDTTTNEDMKYAERLTCCLSDCP